MNIYKAFAIRAATVDSFWPYSTTTHTFTINTEMREAQQPYFEY